jgi:hypothetical protein
MKSCSALRRLIGRDVEAYRNEGCADLDRFSLKLDLDGTSFSRCRIPSDRDLCSKNGPPAACRPKHCRYGNQFFELSSRCSKRLISFASACIGADLDLDQLRRDLAGALHPVDGPIGDSLS